MIRELTRVATGLFGEGRFTIDWTMRQIPDHFHAHARDRDWWARRHGSRLAGGYGRGAGQSSVRSAASVPPSMKITDPTKNPASGPSR
jgi:hypothetical protein